jgi:hypothetical protein
MDLSFFNSTENIVEQPFDSHSFANCGFQVSGFQVVSYFPGHRVCIYVSTHVSLYTQEMSVALAPRGHICFWGGGGGRWSDCNAILNQSLFFCIIIAVCVFVSLFMFI